MNDKPHILLVEDDPVALKVMTASLSHVFDVSTATKSSEALELLRTRAFDCVVTDWYMEGGDGGTMISAVHAMPEETRPEIFVVTAADVHLIGPHARELGAIGAMQKPCVPQLLVAMLAQALARHEAPKRGNTAARPAQQPRRATAQLPRPVSGRQTSTIRRTRFVNKPHLLLVEGSPAIAGVLQGYLASRYVVEVAPSVHEAVTAVAHRNFDIIVSDWIIGAENAHPLLKAAKSRFGDAVSIVIQSSDLSEASQEAALGAGATRFLHKPLSVAHLASAVEKSMAERKQAIQAA